MATSRVVDLGIKGDDASDHAHDKIRKFLTENGHDKAATQGRFSLLSGGNSHITWRLSFDDPGEGDLVIKVAQPDGPLAPYNIAHEAEMMRAAQKLGAIVPDVVGFSLSPDGASDFLVMRHVEGASPSLWEVPKWIEASGDGTRLKIARSVINALRPLRTYPSSSVVDLADSYRAYLCEVELKLRDAAKDVFALPPSVKKVLNWLIERCAELSGSPALYHGDFRLGNIVFKDGNVAALLDWERAMPGHYLHDIGYFSLPAMRTGDLLCGVATQEELVVIWKEEFGEPLDIRLCAFFRTMSMFTEFCVMVRALARLAQGRGRIAGARTLPLVARLHFDMLVGIREWDNGQFHL